MLKERVNNERRDLSLPKPTEEADLMAVKEKDPGYLSFNDARSVLQVFVKVDEELGYELGMEIDYGSRREYVERVLFTISSLIQFENMKEIIQSDKFIIKFD